MNWFRKLICYFRGHEWGDVVYVSPSMLTYCHRCGDEFMGRTVDDLEPMTDEDYQFLDSIIYDD